MNSIKEKFLKLTTRTYPHGTESELFQLLPELFDKLETDEFGNRFIQIGETTTMFTCHLDTATSANVQITHVFDGDIIKSDGKTILGADDKAGVAVMLHMIENKVPGLYYFFLGEEVGCVGSRKLSDHYKNKTKPEQIKKVIAFDRRGLDSIITYQASSRCCSDEFGKALAGALNEASIKVNDNDTVFNYKIDPTGIYTDSAQFTGIYPECTNISVGYYSEHTWSERQNIKHLDKLAKTCCLVDWEALPVKRDPSVKDYSNSYGGSYYGYNRYDDYDEYEDYYAGAYRSAARYNQPKEDKKFFIDYEYGNYASSVTYEKGKENSKKVKSVDFADDRIAYERGLIIELFEYLNVVYRDITWTGEKLIVYYDTGHDFTDVFRAELSEFLPELNFWQEEIEAQKDKDVFESPTWIF